MNDGPEFDQAAQETPEDPSAALAARDDDLEEPEVLDGEEVPRLTDRIVSVLASYSGPLPPASEVARYESVLPGAADRLISLHERREAARLERERDLAAAEIEIAKIQAGIAQKSNNAAIDATRRGQLLAGGIFALILALSAVAVLKGQSLAAILLPIAGMGAALVALYGVNRSEKQRKDSERKSDEPDAESGSADDESAAGNS